LQPMELQILAAAAVLGGFRLAMVDPAVLAS
jgi:hypothetical protein